MGGNLCLKCTEIRLATSSRPAGGAYALPRPLNCNRGATSKGREGRRGKEGRKGRGKGLLIRRTEGRREGTEREGKGISPNVEMSRIKH